MDLSPSRPALSSHRSRLSAAGVCAVFFAVGAALFCQGTRAQQSGRGAREEPTVPEGARITLEFDRPEYFLGENVLAHFVIENAGSAPFQISEGGDYRGAKRSLRFKVTATDEAGRLAEDPDPDLMCMGGMASDPTVKPGEKLTFSVPLIRYRKFDQPGKYAVRVSHDLGWKAAVGGRPLPVAEGTVIFRLPDAAQAEKVVARMESLPQDQNISVGQRSGDYADFSALRQPVYLAPLLRRTEAGNALTLAGIADMETPEATAALIKLAGGSGDAKFTLSAALALNSRLPNPQLKGGMPVRSPFDDGRVEVRRLLVQRAWENRFAPEVRALAARLLARSEAREVSVGAFMVEAVGTPEDAPALLAALEPALEKTLTPRRQPEDNILDDPQPLPELLRAVTVLRGRGYAPDTRLSGNAGFFLYFTGLAGQKAPSPPRWAENFDAFGTSGAYAVREAALRSVPLPLPEACVPKVRAALADKDLGVCMAACELAGKSGDKRFLAPLLELIATENHEWLLRAATNAAQQLGAGFELLPIWAERLSDEHLYDLALDSLQTPIDVPKNGWSGRTDLSRAERLSLREAWRAFLVKHEHEIRAGKRFALDDPAVQPELFGRARQFRLSDGSDWPPIQAARP